VRKHGFATVCASNLPLKRSRRCFVFKFSKLYPLLFLFMRFLVILIIIFLIAKAAQ